MTSLNSRANISTTRAGAQHVDTTATFASSLRARSLKSFRKVIASSVVDGNGEGIGLKSVDATPSSRASAAAIEIHISHVTVSDRERSEDIVVKSAQVSISATVRQLSASVS